MESRHEPDGVATLGMARALVLGGFVAFTCANVIHNRFGLDPAIVPPLVFVGLSFWRPRRWVLLAAAFVIGLPSLLFFQLGAFETHADALYTLNHVFLLLAALFAIGGAVLVVRKPRVSLTR